MYDVLFWWLKPRTNAVTLPTSRVLDASFLLPLRFNVLKEEFGGFNEEKKKKTRLFFAITQWLTLNLTKNPTTTAAHC